MSKRQESDQARAAQNKGGRTKGKRKDDAPLPGRVPKSGSPSVSVKGWPLGRDDDRHDRE